MAFARLFDKHPTVVAVDRDKIHELVDSVIYHLHDLQKKYYGYHIDRISIARRKKNFDIAVASMNANPQFFTNFCKKRILQELNGVADALKELFKKEAGETFITLLNGPPQSDVEVKPLSSHEQLINYIEKNYAPDSDINQVDKNGFTRLSWACHFGDLTHVKKLLEAKANPNVMAHCGETALIRAGYKEHFNVCRELLRSGANPKICHDGNNSILPHSILLQAIKTNQIDIVESILNDSEFDINNRLARESFVCTINSSNQYCFMLFINKGIDVNFYVGDETPLILAAKKNNLTILQILIQRGAILEAPDKRMNCMAYHHAHRNKSISAMKLLLDPILTEEKYASRDMIDPERLIDDIASCRIYPFTDPESADKYTLLMLLNSHQQKLKILNNPKSPFLSESGFRKLNTIIDSIRKNNKQICDIVDVSVAGMFPDVILSIIDDYNHPHSHFSRAKMR